MLAIVFPITNVGYCFSYSHNISLHPIAIHRKCYLLSIFLLFILFFIYLLVKKKKKIKKDRYQMTLYKGNPIILW